MTLTPFGFLDGAERLLVQMSVPGFPEPGNLLFQRFMNLAEQHGSLEISAREGDGSGRALGVVYVRLMDAGREPCLQGWFQPEGDPNRRAFVVTNPEGVNLDEKIRALAEDWAGAMAR